MSHRSSRRFFHRLWRFNAVVIAAVALMALAYGALAGFYIARDALRTRNVASIAPAAPADEAQQSQRAGQTPQLEALSFSQVGDTHVMYAALSSVDRATL